MAPRTPPYGPPAGPHANSATAGTPNAITSAAPNVSARPIPAAAGARPLADLVGIARRYTRSVNLERDLTVAHSVEGYVPTPRGMELLGRVLAAADGPSPSRAWTLTGVYGSGKSAFAHFLAALLGPKADGAREAAMRILRPAPDDGRRLAGALARLATGGSEHGFVRAVVTAQREPLAATVLRALKRGVDLRWGGRQGRRPDVVDEVAALAARAAAGKAVDGRAVLALVAGVADASRTGLLLVVDELGKSLEHAARSVGADDMYLLQQLAELPRADGAPPVLVLGLLHQAFADYGAGLTAVQRTEWGKVQGRFEDVPFTDGPEQMVRLTAAAIRQAFPAPLAGAVQTAAAAWRAHLDRDPATAYAASVLGADAIARVYPLHPVAALVLPALCARYGQHDRSLFTFLTSQEPQAFGHLLRERFVSVPPAEGAPDGTGADEGPGAGALPSVQVADVYDYFVETAAGGGGRGAAQRWAEVQAAVHEARHLEPDVLRALKTVGTLNLLATAGGALRASRALVVAALSEAPSEAEAARWTRALAALEQKGVVTYRRLVDEYRVWEGSDFDVEGAVRQRLEADRAPLDAVLGRVAPLAPLVAQRHSYETGTLRYFDRAYVGTEEALRALGGRTPESDGVVAYWTGAAPPAAAPAETADRLPLVVVAAVEHAPLAAAAAEVAALEHVERHAAELQRDGVARKEVRQRLALAQRALDVARRHALEHPAGQPCWVAGARERLVARQLNRRLSDLCDRTYPAGPRLWNELINRRELTSQGARARRELIEAMLRAPGAERLGLAGDGPEVSMYASVLLESGIHRPDEDGVWGFGPPTAPGLRPVWDAIEAFCREADDAARPLDGLWERLTRAPYGAKRGVIPVLLAAVLLAHADDVSVYRDGTFLAALGAEHFELLVKQPSRFAVKHFALTGIRWEMFKELEAVVRRADRGDARPAGVAARAGAGGGGAHNATLLRVVRPLVRFAATLPPATLKTRALSPEALAVRDALLSAREPDVLLFATLPAACGLPPAASPEDVPADADPDGGTSPAAGPAYSARFRRRLVEVLRELETAYERQLDRCRALLHSAFGVSQDVTRLREALRVRAHPLAAQCVEPRLRAFTRAAAAEGTADRAWLEALAMIVADKPADAWSDDDALAFELNLGDVARRFANLEALYKDAAVRGGDAFEARRVTITAQDGSEVHRFVWVDRQQRATVDAVVQELVGHLTHLLPEQQAAVAAALAEAVLRDRAAPMIAPAPAEDVISQTPNTKRLRA